MIKLCIEKFYYDSALIGFKSLNTNTPRYYSTCGNNKPKIEDENLQIHPWFITGFVLFFFLLLMLRCGFKAKEKI